MNTQLLSTGQVARLLGVPIHRVIYAHTSGRLQEPALWFMGKRAYSVDDVKRVAGFFSDDSKNSSHQIKETTR